MMFKIVAIDFYEIYSIRICNRQGVIVLVHPSSVCLSSRFRLRAETERDLFLLSLNYDDFLFPRSLSFLFHNQSHKLVDKNNLNSWIFWFFFQFLNP